MNAISRHQLIGDTIRFLIAGGLNTAVTFIFYQVALVFVRPSIAYAGSWLFGLMLTVFVFPQRVFSGALIGSRQRLLLTASYVGVFCVGLILLSLVIDATGAPRLAIVVVIAASTVCNFLSARLIMRFST